MQNIPEQWGNKLSSLTAAGQLYILSTPSADLTSSTPINPPKALVHAGGRTMRAGAGGRRSATRTGGPQGSGPLCGARHVAGCGSHHLRRRQW